MYNVGQTRAWSLPHLKTGCWYLDCGKAFCPEEEEELKASIEAKDTASGSLPADEDADDDDEKDKKKEDAKKAKGKGKEKKKKDKKDEGSKEKTKRPVAKAGKKAEGSSKKVQDQVETVSDDTMSEGNETVGHHPVQTVSTGSLKRDAAFAGLSLSRMQPDFTGRLSSSGGQFLNVDEFFFRGSLLSNDDHYLEHKEFPKEWKQLVSFIERVCG
jgi:hypothetical protein